MKETDANAQFFTFRAPLMAPGGGHREFLVETDHLRVGWLSNCQSGEDDIHMHPDEPHVFFVLKGGAVFRDKEGKETHVKEYSGVMIPPGYYYSFVAEGDEPLVMLRFNTWTEGRTKVGRLGPDGKKIARDIDSAKRPPDRRIPGAFFPK